MATKCRPAHLVLALVLALATVGGQQSPTFKSGVQVVLLDVSVVDQSGRPVVGLVPADFVVTVDRRQRPVVTAQFLQYDTTSRVQTASPSSDSAATPRGAAATPVRPALVPRSLLIVIDEDNLETADGILARRTAENLIDRLMPEDRVGVTTIPRLPGRLSMTSDHLTAKKALSAVLAGAPRDEDEFNIGLAEAFGVERGDPGVLEDLINRGCYGIYGRGAQAAGTGASPSSSRQTVVNSDPDCPHRVRLQVQRMQIQTHLRGQRTIDAMSAIADYLRQVSGPKVMVFITGGMPMPEMRSTSSFARIDRSFAEGQVSLYTLHLQRMSITDVRGRLSPTPGEDDSLLSEGVENLTARAGGTLLLAIGTMDQYVDRLITELSGSYLLGIDVPPTESDDHPHEVNVRVTRPGVVVRARRQYVIAHTSGIGKALDAAAVAIDTNRTGTGATLAAPEVARIMTAGKTLEETGEIAIEARATMGNVVGTKEVVVEARIDPRTLYLGNLADRRLGRIAIALFCGNARRAVVGEAWQEINLSLTDATYQKFKQVGIPYTIRVPVTEKARYVKLVVYDRRSDRVGARVAKVKER